MLHAVPFALDPGIGWDHDVRAIFWNTQMTCREETIVTGPLVGSGITLHPALERRWAACVDALGLMASAAFSGLRWIQLHLFHQTARAFDLQRDMLGTPLREFLRQIMELWQFSLASTIAEIILRVFDCN